MCVSCGDDEGQPYCTECLALDVPTVAWAFALYTGTDVSHWWGLAEPVAHAIRAHLE